MLIYTYWKLYSLQLFESMLRISGQSKPVRGGIWSFTFFLERCERKTTEMVFLLLCYTNRNMDIQLEKRIQVSAETRRSRHFLSSMLESPLKLRKKTLRERYTSLEALGILEGLPHTPSHQTPKLPLAQ